MTVTPLALLKSQLNLDHDLDDALLTHHMNVAEEWIGAFVGKPFADHDPVPASLTHAVLLLASYWYSQREAASFGVSTQAVPFGVFDLLRPFRDQVTGHVPE